MHHELGNHTFFPFTDLFFGIPALLAIGFYIKAVLATNQRIRLRKWPWKRTISFVAGVL